MNWFINLAPEETFRSLMIYLNGKRVKTIASARPSYVKAEIGSWLSFVDEGNAKGEVEAKIKKENGGSLVCLNFSFTKEYALGFVAAVSAAFSFCVIGLGLPFIIGTSSLGLVEPWSIAGGLLIFLFLSVISFAIIIWLECYAVSRTKKRLMKEFDLFPQLLSKKQ